MEDFHQPRRFSPNPEEREALINQHPIIVKDYIVLTPMIQFTYGLVRERLWMRRTGSFLHARPRMGKTRCALAVRRLIQAEFPSIFLMFLSADQRRNALDTGLIADMLESDGLLLERYTPFKKMFSRLLTHITTQVGSRAGAQFVLLIDEMQMLGESDFRLLLVLHNRLELNGIAMTTIGFAQPEILHIRSAMVATKSYNLIARFLGEPIPFDGCAGKEDLETILTGYDEEKCFPEDTDCTYTKFFLPMAYESGFRLKKYSRSIWNSLKTAAEPLGSKSVPMEHLTRTVEYLLIANRTLDSESFSLDEKAINAAVKASNLSNFGGLMGNE